jgi:lipid A ethanolaminephosphotransferase
MMFTLRGKTLPAPHVDATTLNLAAAAYLVFCLNGPFWRAVSSKLGPETAQNILLLGATGLFLLLIFNILFSAFSFKPIHKPLLITIIILAAFSGYFMESYGIVVDKQMIVNLLETDSREAMEQVTWPLFRHLFLMGVIPSLLLLATKVSYRPWRRELMTRMAVILASGTVLALMVALNFKQFALFGRANKQLRMYINPTYPIYSALKVVTKNARAQAKGPLKVVAADATRTASTKRTVVVLVVGETARAQNLSLNGYSRDTNPELGARDVFNFTDVQSCGTDTAESLPCMFSHLGRDNYRRDEARQYENLLDILQRTGVQVLWRDNNSGSKGVSDRVATEDLSKEKDATLCPSGECFDEILLRDLATLLSRESGDTLIVLHQKGSHGPSYYRRSPERFKRFLPECTQDNVQDCDRQSIVNAYDNTIVYTDHVLAKLIDMLKAQKFATAMLYVSDHGESLGENNLYLHGLPYAIAPQEQTHVPMIFWASDTFLREKGIDANLLRKQAKGHFSHDNLFHTMLGLFRVTTQQYRRDMDIFHSS